MSHKILRRFHGYDYACGGLIEPALTRRGDDRDGGAMFVTVMLAERKPHFSTELCLAIRQVEKTP